MKIKQTTIWLSETDELIFRVLSPDRNRTEGMRIAATWAAHFHNLGLRHDDPLDCVGLAVKTPKGNATWDEYHNSND